jgi:hypothetical protein
MYKLDTSQFPILIQTTDDAALTVDDMVQFERVLQSVFDRQQLFGIVALVTSENETKAPKEVTKASNDMFKRLKPQFAQWCVGYAGVTQVGKWLKLYKPIANIAVRSRMGCDGAVFEHEDEARVWLFEKLKEKVT